MTSTVIKAAIVLALAQPGLAIATDTADPEKRQAAEQILRLNGPTQGYLVDMETRVWPMIAGEVRRNNPDVTDATLADLKKEYMLLMTNAVEPLMPTLADIYAKHFTAEEMRQLYAFQSSDLGRKVVTLSPQMMGEMIPLMTVRAKEIQPDVIAAFRKKLDERGLKN